MSKKHKEKTSPAITSGDSYSLVTYTEKANENFIQQLKNTLQQAEKSGKITEVVLNTLAGATEKIKTSPEINNYIESGTLVIHESNKVDIAGAAKLCTENYFILCDIYHEPNINDVLHGFAIKKRQSTARLFIEKTSFKNKGINLFRFLFNFFLRLFTPVAYKNIYTNCVIINKEDADILLNDLNFNSFRNINLAYRAKLHSITTDSFSVAATTKNKNAVDYLLGIFNIVAIAIKQRIYWHLKLPYKELFKKGEKNTVSLTLINSNHPAYRFIFGIVFVLSLVIFPILSTHYNLTWDEPLHSEYAVDMVNYYTTFGEDTSVFNLNKRAYGTMLYYGSSFDFFAEIVHNAFPVFGIYETRHVLNSLVGLIGFVFAALLARLIAGWRAGLLCFIFLVFSPSYFGQIMNNPKDIPFASSFIMGIYFMFLLFKELPQPSFKSIAGTILSIAWSISIRPGGMILIGFVGAFLGIDWLIRAKKDKLKNTVKLIWPYTKYLVITGVAGYFLGLIFWPYAIQNPLKNPFIALEQMTNFSFLTIYELFEGVKMFDNKPWYYLPKYILITAPLFVLLGVILSATSLKRIKPVYLFLVLFAIVFPSAYAIYQDSLLYNGWRHFLFIYPPIVVLAGIGWDNIFSTSKNKIITIITVVLLIASVGKTKWWMLQNHPLEYIYYNELVGGVKGAYGNYETDYWCQSTRPAIEWLIKNKPEIKNKKTIVATNNEYHSVLHHAQKVSDSIKIAWAREMEWNKQNWDYAIWTSRTLSREQLFNGAFPPKGTIHIVDVEGVPIAAVVERKNTFMPDGYKLFDANNYKAAAESFKKATEYDPNDEESFRELGWAQFYLGEYDNSIKSFERSIQIRPDNSFSYGFMGAAYMRKGDNEKALQCLQSSVKYKVNNSMAYDIMGDIYFNMKKYDLAIANYELTAKHGGESPQLYNKIGKCYVGKYSLDPGLGKSNLENALAYLEAAIKVDPKFPEPYYTIGMILTQQGKKAEGEKYIQRAKELMSGGK